MVEDSAPTVTPAQGQGEGKRAATYTNSDATSAGGGQGESASQGTEEKTSRRPAEFQSTHTLKFGLEVVAREDSGSVTAVLCLFCKHFGREAKIGAKRRATTNFKYFKRVFRTDQYLQHHRLQHPIKWAEYDAASVREKQTFFPRYLMAIEGGLDTVMKSDVVISSTNSTKRSRKGDRPDSAGRENDESRTRGVSATIVASQRTEDTANSFHIPADIVALFLRDQALKPSGLLEIVNESNTTPAVCGVHKLTISDWQAFRITTDLCATGLSTSQITRTMHAMAKYCPATIGSVWKELVQNYVEAGIFASVTMLAKLVSPCWALSIGFHTSSPQETTEQDCVHVRVRFLSNHLQDFHLVTVPTSESAANHVTKVLDVVCPRWPESLIGISVDGNVFSSSSVSITIQALRSRSTNGNTIAVTWNGKALLARGIRQLCHQLMNGTFAETCWRLRAYIKSESKLIQEIGHEADTITEPYANTSSRGSTEDASIKEILVVTRWLTDKRVRIRKYINETDLPPTCRPCESWWMCLAVFDWIASSTADALKTLDGLVPATQTTRLCQLVTEITSAFRVESNPGIEKTALPNVVQYHAVNGSCTTTKTGMLEFIVELGAFVNSLLTSFQGHDLDIVLESLGKCVATFVETLQVGLRHAEIISVSSNTGNDLPIVLPPPILPHELAKLSGKEFTALVSAYRTPLLARFTEEDFDTLEQEHQTLKRAMRERESRGEEDLSESFDASWARTLGRFRSLHAFAGGLASLLPLDRSISQTDLIATAGHTMEAMDLATEAPLQAAQFHQLHELYQSSIH